MCSTAPALCGRSVLAAATLPTRTTLLRLLGTVSASTSSIPGQVVPAVSALSTVRSAVCAAVCGHLASLLPLRHPAPPPPIHDSTCRAEFHQPASHFVVCSATIVSYTRARSVAPPPMLVVAHPSASTAPDAVGPTNSCPWRTPSRATLANSAGSTVPTSTVRTPHSMCRSRLPTCTRCSTRVGVPRSYFGRCALVSALSPLCRLYSHCCPPNHCTTTPLAILLSPLSCVVVTTAPGTCTANGPALVATTHSLFPSSSTIVCALVSMLAPMFFPAGTTATTTSASRTFCNLQLSHPLRLWVCSLYNHPHSILGCVYFCDVLYNSFRSGFGCPLHSLLYTFFPHFLYPQPYRVFPHILYSAFYESFPHFLYSASYEFFPHFLYPQSYRVYPRILYSVFYEFFPHLLYPQPYRFFPHPLYLQLYRFLPHFLYHPLHELSPHHLPDPCHNHPHNHPCKPPRCAVRPAHAGCRVDCGTVSTTAKVATPQRRGIPSTCAHACTCPASTSNHGTSTRLALVCRCRLQFAVMQAEESPGPPVWRLVVEFPPDYRMLFAHSNCPSSTSTPTPMYLQVCGAWCPRRDGTTPYVRSNSTVCTPVLKSVHTFVQRFLKRRRYRGSCNCGRYHCAAWSFDGTR
uniref:Uncharacterized protein n=1 Tax=Lygus hesperus TaxID=30085 RepID=A0A146MB54_LYGHE